MEKKLIERTVFHEIELKKDDDDILADGEIVLPDPEWEGLNQDEETFAERQKESDEEWDTDLDEADGKYILMYCHGYYGSFIELLHSDCM